MPGIVEIIILNKALELLLVREAFHGYKIDIYLSVILRWYKHMAASSYTLTCWCDTVDLTSF